MRRRLARVGSIGDVNAFSFCQDKIFTTGGEGEMLTTNDTDFWSRAWAFKDHGKATTPSINAITLPDIDGCTKPSVRTGG